jgi:hypothetical protein
MALAKSARLCLNTALASINGGPKSPPFILVSVARGWQGNNLK